MMNSGYNAFKQLKRKSDMLCLVQYLVYMFIIVVISSLFVSTILGLLLGSEKTLEISESLFGGITFVCALVVSLVIYSIITINILGRAKADAQAAQNNLQVIENITDMMLDKAKQIVEKHMSHEQAVFSSASKLSALEELIYATERFPELKANESIMRLIAQIERSEKNMLAEKVNCNYLIGQYNALTESFPNRLFVRIGNFKRLEY